MKNNSVGSRSSCFRAGAVLQLLFMNKKFILEVGCAIIERQGKILIAQRRDEDHLGGYWEFPGGKKEIGEMIEECLVREALEELDVVIRPRRLLREITYSYPERDLRLIFWLCDWQDKEPRKIECQDFRWIHPDELRNFKFPPADADLIEEIILNQGSYFGMGS